MLAILEADNRVSRLERVPVHVRESSRGHLLLGDEADVPGRQRVGAQVLCVRASRKYRGEEPVAVAEEVSVKSNHHGLILIFNVVLIISWGYLFVWVKQESGT